jgi:hypothetical protein
MNDLRFVRQQDVVNMSHLTSLGVTIIGLGAIGSTCAVWLGKMGCVGLTCYDPDVIQDFYWSNQMYRDSDTGSLKASAPVDVMEQFGGHTPNAIAQRYVDQNLSEVVISAVDSMESRKIIWKSVREQSQVRLFLDARMGLETLIVYAMRPQIREDRVTYSQSLVSDDQTLQEPCTARTVCYTPLMAAAVLCNLVKRFVNDEEMPRRIVLDLAAYTLLTEPR